MTQIQETKNVFLEEIVSLHQFRDRFFTRGPEQLGTIVVPNGDKLSAIKQWAKVVGVCGVGQYAKKNSQKLAILGRVYSARTSLRTVLIAARSFIPKSDGEFIETQELDSVSDDISQRLNAKSSAGILIYADGHGMVYYSMFLSPQHEPSVRRYLGRLDFEGEQMIFVPPTRVKKYDLTSQRYTKES